MLSRGFQRQGDHDALNVVPFLNDQSGVEFADGPEHHVLIILARMLESVEGLPHLVIDIPVAWCKLIAEDVENRKVDFVGPVGIS